MVVIVEINYSVKLKSKAEQCSPNPTVEIYTGYFQMRDEISVKIFKDNCQENNFKVKIVKSESEFSTMLISWVA